MAVQAERLDLRLDAAEKRELLFAAELQGTSLSAFLREAARERARQVIADSQERNRVVLGAQESRRLLDALDAPFVPNARLERALELSRQIPR